MITKHDYYLKTKEVMGLTFTLGKIVEESPTMTEIEKEQISAINVDLTMLFYDDYLLLKDEFEPETTHFFEGERL